MGSLTYEIANSRNVKKAEAYNKQHLKLKKIAKENHTKPPKQRGPTNSTVQQYKNHAIKFGEWCKEEYRCRHFEDCISHIQDYADFLVAQGKCATTIHTYLTGVCFVFGVPLGEIKKPKRHAADIARRRGRKKENLRKDAQPSCSPRLAQFSEMVGCRRDDYVTLRKDYLQRDESGYLCVYIPKGKGGKPQLQRIPEDAVDGVSAYFNGNHEEFVFTKREVTNKLDLHHYRHMLSLRQYRYYVQRLDKEPGYREQLIAEIKARWVIYNSRRLNKKDLCGVYRMRGKNRELAQEYGFQYSFERLAIMAVSIFHLSHWRAGVTVLHYVMTALVYESECRNDEQ